MAEFDINKVQDIQLSDRNLYQQFLDLWRGSNYNSALKLLDDNAQLNNKQFLASCINIINAALTYLQENYFTDVESQLSVDIEIFNASIAEFVNRHNYSSTEQYEINNFVLYNNEYYLCIKQPPIGTLPTDTQYWVYLGLIGEQGAIGTGFTMRYSWNNTTEYNQYDVVYVQDINTATMTSGYLYVAKRDNIGASPQISPDDWDAVMEVPLTQITISENPPVDPYDGQIWFQVKSQVSS